MKEVEKTPRRVLVITGPTAAGKTALGVELALRLRRTFFPAGTCL